MLSAFGSTCQNPPFFGGVLVSFSSPTHLCLFSVLILLPSPLPHWKKKTTANKSSYISNRLVYERRFHVAGVRNEHFEFTQNSFVPLLPRRGFGLLIPGDFKTAEAYKGGF